MSNTKQTAYLIRCLAIAQRKGWDAMARRYAARIAAMLAE